MEKSAEIKSVISCSGFNSTKELFESYMQAVWLKGISLCVSLYEYIIFGKRSTYKGTDGINKSNVKVLVLHSLYDDVLHFESGIVARKCMITNKRAICVECNKKGHNILRRVDDESKLDEEQMVKLLDFMRGENNNG